VPKMKTRKTAYKRIKVTGSGRLRRRHTAIGHLKRKKSRRRLRRLYQDADIARADAKRARRMLPGA